MATAMQVSVVGLDIGRALEELDKACLLHGLSLADREHLAAKRRRFTRGDLSVAERALFQSARASERADLHDARIQENLNILCQYRDAGAFSPDSLLIPYERLATHPRGDALVRQALRGLAGCCEKQTLLTYLPYWKQWHAYASNASYPVFRLTSPEAQADFDTAFEVFILERAEGADTKTAVSRVTTAVSFVFETLNKLPRIPLTGVIAQQSATVERLNGQPVHQMRPVEPWMVRRALETWGASNEPGKRLVAHAVHIAHCVMNRFSDINRTDVSLTLRMESPKSPTATHFYYVWACRKHKKHVFYIPVSLLPEATHSCRKSFLLLRDLVGTASPFLLCDTREGPNGLQLVKGKRMAYPKFSKLFLRLLADIGVPTALTELRQIPGSKRRRRLMNTQSIRAGGASQLDVLNVPRETITAIGGWRQQQTMLLYSRSQLQAHLAASRQLQGFHA